jgi:DNA helicase-2/ATP-dependent DNA helicase PcrA
MDFEHENKTVIISDYKTGTPESKWTLPPSASQYERIKMYRYKNQLMFYKLLVDGSADWGKKGWRAEGGVLRFLKKNPYGKLNLVPLIYDSREMADFNKLIVSVWNHIQTLDFPDTKNYTPDISGIFQFEKDLINGTI